MAGGFSGIVQLPPGKSLLPLRDKKRRSLLPLDWNSDFRMDLAVCGSGGLKLALQGNNSKFEVQEKIVPESLSKAGCGAVWAVDLEMDGDLDLLMVTGGSAVRALQNNADGSAILLDPFQGLDGARAFAWGDLDLDGDPDAVFLDGAGRLRIYANERGGRFRSLSGLPDQIGRDLVMADTDGDGHLELLLLTRKGGVKACTLLPGHQGWSCATLIDPPVERDLPEKLLLGDLDNNGALDLALAGPSRTGIWLGTGGDFSKLEKVLDFGATALADIDGDGRLEVMGLTKDGEAVLARSRGTLDYRWQVLRLRAQQVAGDQRINSFGLGSVVEFRAGLQYQKLLVEGPLLHIGLGRARKSDVVRILWPNGTVQAEFDLDSNAVAVAEQRLKGSCPWLFAFDGQEVRFVTDLIWRSPLGLRINAQETAGVVQTEDRVKIPGFMLFPVDGQYDLRITAELWETHFFDHLSLMVIDHPADTEISIDERFSIPPPSLDPVLTSPLRPILRALAQGGNDVTTLIREKDGQYLASFGLGRYQGIANEHFVELELPQAADGHGYLVAEGWVQPTDSSLNVAMGQGRHSRPTPLSLETYGPDGHWRIARKNIGLPAGKNKRMLIPLKGLFEPFGPRRLRLRTNLEIYWDRISWVEAPSGASIQMTRLPASKATLHHRGYSVVERASRSAPELPRYGTLQGIGQRWLDLEGFYTRYGDVLELLETTDDRTVIMNAGDELLLKFAAPDPPPSGWRRDFVLVADGWVKDGDYNTAFSKTVRPLPSHDWPQYDSMPASLEAEPVFRRYPGDWLRYHTRYATPEPFFQALVPAKQD